jgi:CTP:molybdopterin cytidylyltransferase MocA
MGEGPKALVRLRGRTFLEHAITTCQSGGARPVATVARQEDQGVRALAVRLGAVCLTNPDPDRGMFSSVRVGLAGLLNLAPDLLGVVIFPVDHATVRAETVAAISSELRSGGGLVVPVHEGQDGHPIGLGPAVARALLALPSEAVLREALAQLGAEVRRIPVSDPGVLRNMNTRRDLPTGAARD